MILSDFYSFQNSEPF